MRKKIWHALFGDEPLMKQAYTQFFLSLLLVPVFFLSPLSVQVVVIGLLSCWAISITAQGFISAAASNKKLTEVICHMEEMLERLSKVETKVDEVQAEQVEAKTVIAENLTTENITVKDK